MSKAKPYIAASSSTVASTEGAQVYMSNCVFCHGADGKKMYRNAPDLTKTSFNEDAIKQIVREGSKGKMPSYNIIISDDNIAAVAKYVSTMHSGTNSSF
jgi:mono/diheme cytochrome c family protein